MFLTRKRLKWKGTYDTKPLLVRKNHTFASFPGVYISLVYVHVIFQVISILVNYIIPYKMGETRVKELD